MGARISWCERNTAALSAVLYFLIIGEKRYQSSRNDVVSAKKLFDILFQRVFPICFAFCRNPISLRNFNDFDDAWNLVFLSILRRGYIEALFGAGCIRAVWSPDMGMSSLSPSGLIQEGNTLAAIKCEPKNSVLLLMKVFLHFVTNSKFCKDFSTTSTWLYFSRFSFPYSGSDPNARCIINSVCNNELIKFVIERKYIFVLSSIIFYTCLRNRFLIGVWLQCKRIPRISELQSQRKRKRKRLVRQWLHCFFQHTPLSFRG